MKNEDSGRDHYDLSVVIPVHNSDQVLANTIQRWKDRLVTSRSEVILVENGSTDASWEVAQREATDTEHVRFTLLQAEKGMGNALRAGIDASSGEAVLLSADDLPFGFDDLDQAALLGRRPPVIIGSKAHPDSEVSRGFSRSLFTFGYRVLRSIVLRSRVGDTQGTILVDGDWVRSISRHLNEPGFLFTTQLVLIAENSGLEIVEVPVTLYEDAISKPSTVRWSDVFEMARGLARVKSDVRHIGSTSRETR